MKVPERFETISAQMMMMMTSTIAVFGYTEHWLCHHLPLSLILYGHPQNCWYSSWPFPLTEAPHQTLYLPNWLDDLNFSRYDPIIGFSMMPMIVLLAEPVGSVVVAVVHREAAWYHLVEWDVSVDVAAAGVGIVDVHLVLYVWVEEED